MGTLGKVMGAALGVGGAVMVYMQFAGVGSDPVAEQKLPEDVKRSPLKKTLTNAGAAGRAHAHAQEPARRPGATLALPRRRIEFRLPRPQSTRRLVVRPPHHTRPDPLPSLPAPSQDCILSPRSRGRSSRPRPPAPWLSSHPASRARPSPRAVGSLSERAPACCLRSAHIF